MPPTSSAEPESPAATPANPPLTAGENAPEPEIASTGEPSPVALPAQAETEWGAWWWWLAGLAGLALLTLIALLMFGKKRSEESEPEGLEQEETAEETGVSATLASIPLKQQETAPRPVDRFEQVELRLEPEWLRLSLVYATVSYNLQIANRGQEPTGPLRISADMISAHASRSNSEQLTFDRERAGTTHDVRSLVSGEVASLKGELRLHLSEVHRVNRGQQALFLPLLRFLVELEGGQGECVRVFTLGEQPRRTGAGMMPLRLDLGPRLIAQIDSREVDVQRWSQADGLRRAG